MLLYRSETTFARRSFQILTNGPRPRACVTQTSRILGIAALPPHRCKIDAKFVRDRALHAKLALTEPPDGSRAIERFNCATPITSRAKQRQRLTDGACHCRSGPASKRPRRLMIFRMRRFQSLQICSASRANNPMMTSVEIPEGLQPPIRNTAIAEDIPPRVSTHRLRMEIRPVLPRLSMMRCGAASSSCLKDQFIHLLLPALIDPL
jgi:hypothetical protein